ncbi:MAG: hypothetical protein HZA90_19310 [Verrucomicrobia bacterium]|nr:hypothetical protein [Verrucomicrobiota bacterium]
MPRERRDVEAGLLCKGFQQREGDHHYFIYFTEEGQKSRVVTKTSHSMKEIPDVLLCQMARQCRLTKALFLGLVDCPLNRGDYERLLDQGGQL